MPSEAKPASALPASSAAVLGVAEDELVAALGGGPSDAAETRERILHLAKDILLRRSFHSFSYQDLADGIGIRKASIHYHFPSKEDLGVALIERIGAAMQRFAVELSESQRPPEERLAAFFRVMRGLLDEGDKICVFGVLGAEFNALPPRMQTAYAQLLESQQKWLARVLERGRERGVFAFAGPPDAEALIVSSTVQGALQIARASRQPQRFDAVVAAIESRLGVRPAAAS
ncbi:MAG TPA: TetR/AcrR family transcriptional regulator [Thermoanaerobaculia bacterium]|nr:TetR/AcrR family transcriptional regulator [Thermoanaerobaculia bacterium]